MLGAALLGLRAAEAQSLLWNFKTNGEVYSSPALGPDGTVYVGSSDNNIYAITSAGGLKWKYPTNGAVASSPALGPDRTVIHGSHGPNIHTYTSGGASER